MQLLAKFKNILYLGFRATLKFQKKIIKFYNKKKFHCGHSVAMVTYRVTKILHSSVHRVTVSILNIVLPFGSIITI